MVFEYGVWNMINSIFGTDRSVVCGLCGLPNRHFELFIGGITPHDPKCTDGNESKMPRWLSTKESVWFISDCLSRSYKWNVAELQP